jgi:hypothetical protein
MSDLFLRLQLAFPIFGRPPFCLALAHLAFFEKNFKSRYTDQPFFYHDFPHLEKNSKLREAAEPAARQGTFKPLPLRSQVSSFTISSPITAPCQPVSARSMARPLPVLLTKGIVRASS